MSAVISGDSLLDGKEEKHYKSFGRRLVEFCYALLFWGLSALTIWVAVLTWKIIIGYLFLVLGVLLFVLGLGCIVSMFTSKSLKQILGVLISNFNF